MKKFRVAKVDGTYEIIEATNMENAISIARNKFGQLPNDINNKIVEDISHSIQLISRSIENNSKQIRLGAKELDWNRVYVNVHRIIDELILTSKELEKQAGSMVKINKEEI